MSAHARRPSRVDARTVKYSVGRGRSWRRRVAELARASMLALALVLAVDASAAGNVRTLRVAFPVAETGFDPQAAGDAFSFYVCDAIFDSLYTYDYFARPAKLVPKTAEGMPLITDGGRTYTIRVRPGIYFADDPAFRGQRRELVAQDYVYSMKRILDPKVRSYWLYLFEKHLTGADAALAAARKSNRFDYDARLPGLEAIDRYTLRVRFDQPDYAFAHWLTSGPFTALAREVVEAHRDASNRVMEHPVGTGPFRLAEWVRAQKIVLERNPGYRVETYPTPGPGSTPEDAAIARDNQGKRLPIVDRVEISIVEEGQPRLLAFDRGGFDYLSVPATLAPTVLTGDRLRPELAARGIALHRQVDPSVAFAFFNLDNPVVGGYTPERIALRRAISLALDRRAYIDKLLNGQALPATQMVPPGVSGHDPNVPVRNPFDPGAARALLDRFGYRDRDGDGYRETPEGRPLTLVKGSTTANADRDADELWKRSMDAIGIRITFLKNKWPELNKMSEAGQLMMWNLAWTTSVADGDTFYSILYSGNIGTSNDARLRLPEYDRVYEAARRLPEGKERAALYRQLSDLVINYAPWILLGYPVENTLTQPWLKGYKLHPFIAHNWKYYDVTRP